MNASLAPVRQAASKPRQLARRVIKNPRLLEKVVEGLGTETALVKFLKGVRNRAKAPPA
jgi:hypothetical protein